MTEFTSAEEAGIVRPITIDGLDLNIAIGGLSIDAAPIFQSVETIDGGSVTYQPSVPGGPNLVDRYSFSFPISVVSGPTRRELERIRARGGYHTLAAWKPVTAFYTITASIVAAGVASLVLPRYRRNAPELYAGLVHGGVVMGTDVAPFRAWLNGAPLVVTYGGASPAAGTANLLSAPYATGQLAGYTGLQVGGVVAGDVVEIEWFPAFSVLLTSPRLDYPGSVAETISYQFLER